MARRALHRLTAKRIEGEKEPGRYSDGGGLYLQVQKAAGGGRGVTKSWLFRYRRVGELTEPDPKTGTGGGNPKTAEMGLGPWPDVPLATQARADGKVVTGARDLAADARRFLLAGVDPLEARKSARGAATVAAAGTKSFKDCAEAYMKAHRKGWRNDKHAAQWENTLETYAYGKIGALPVAAIDTAQIVRILEPLWTEKNETASRLRGRIERILDWSAVHGYRTGLNPARWRGHLDHALPKVSRLARIEHHPALPFDDAPAFIKTLREQEGVAALALEFLILTIARTGEVIGATESEIDVRNRIWTVPGERMKSGREHRVPLVDRALEILRVVKPLRTGEHLFPGRARGSGLSNMALLKTLERMKRDDVTTHGFRSTFSDWAAERTNFPREVVEIALAHTIPNRVEAAYRRGDLFEKRTKVMEAWAAFLEKPPASVTSITGRRAAKGQG